MWGLGRRWALGIWVWEQVSFHFQLQNSMHWGFFFRREREREKEWNPFLPSRRDQTLSDYLRFSAAGEDRVKIPQRARVWFYSSSPGISHSPFLGAQVESLACARLGWWMVRWGAAFSKDSRVLIEWHSAEHGDEVAAPAPIPLAFLPRDLANENQ